MPVLYVLCDAVSGRHRAKVLADAIKKYRDTLPLSDTSYIIKTNSSADDVFAYLRTKMALGRQERLWVFTVPEPYTGQAPANVKTWLQEVSEKVFADDRRR